MVRTGKLMVDEGLVAPEDVDRALTVQEKNGTSPGGSKLLGMVLCDLNLVTPMDNYCVLNKHKKLVSMGSYLIKNNLVSPEMFREIEADAQAKNLPLISYLLELGIIPKPRIRQMLFDLFHIPFRSVSDILFDENSRRELSRVADREMADRHRLIPLQISGNTLTVGITDPANLVVLQHLDKSFPQYRFNPIFIPYSGFTWFYKMLYRVAPSQNRSSRKTAAPLKAAPAAPGPSPESLGPGISVREPENEKEAIQAFYEAYERACRGGRTMNRGDRASRFFEFIRQSHAGIALRFKCRTVDFSLKREKGRVMITALPKKEA